MVRAGRLVGRSECPNPAGASAVLSQEKERRAAGRRMNTSMATRQRRDLGTSRVQIRKLHADGQTDAAVCLWESVGPAVSGDALLGLGAALEGVRAGLLPGLD